MLHCDKLTLMRGDRVIFRDVNLSVAPGSFLWVRGANGSGKTSLLQAISGRMMLQHGCIKWNQVPIEEEYDSYCSIIFYLGHECPLLHTLSVMDNLLFWLKIFNDERGSFALQAALHHFSLSDKTMMPVFMLSEGWKQRVRLCIAMLKPQAALWLLDEPLTHLDQQGKEMAKAMIQAKLTQGGIVLMASHESLGLQKETEFEMSHLNGAEALINKEQQKLEELALGVDISGNSEAR